MSDKQNTPQEQPHEACVEIGAVLHALRDYYKATEGRHSVLWAKHRDAINAAFGHRSLARSESGDSAAPSAFYSEPENCRGCGKPLLVENAWMFDGCPCNTRAGVNDGNLWRWKLLSDLQQRQSRELEAKQAKIDALMLEYCPEEMTKEQTENWARHQRPATEEEARAIDAAASVQSATGLSEDEIHAIHCAEVILSEWENDGDIAIILQDLRAILNRVDSRSKGNG